MITVELDLLDIKDGDLILDAGCGNGRHSWETCKRNRSTIVAFDINREDLQNNKWMLDELKKQNDAKSEYHLIVGDVTKLPFKDGSFDKIICSEVLEHVPDDKGATEELVRVLDKDGAIGISVPHHFAESICWKLSKAYYGFPGGHIRIYKTQQLLDLATSTGLDVYTIRHKHGLHTFYWMLRCLFGIKKENARIPALYHRFLTWEMSDYHRFFHGLDSFINRFSPKSVTIYARKNEHHPSE